MQELEISIDRDGKVSITVRGVKGESCTDLTKVLEEALGKLEERQYTEEYYEPPPTVQQDNIQEKNW